MCLELVGLGRGRAFISIRHGILGLNRVSSVRVYREFRGYFFGQCLHRNERVAPKLIGPTCVNDIS